MSILGATTAELLVSGGDARLTLDAELGVNRYGCAPQPDSQLLDFASSTASVISQAAYLAADRLREKLLRDHQVIPEEQLYARELSRMRGELSELLELDACAAPELIFAASGTDVHRIAAQLARATSKQPLRILMVDESETGSGVWSALCASDADVEVITVALRTEAGTPRLKSDIDNEFISLSTSLNVFNKHVLLIQTDLSKTGMIAPSYECTRELRVRLGGQLNVLIDACQFRWSTRTLNACLMQGYWIALTGSKFIGGPSFSGALLIPTPTDTSTVQALNASSNFGLLLRWEAALCELRAFQALNPAALTNFLQDFATQISTELRGNPAFALIDTPAIDRHALRDMPQWDQIPTVFTFQLYRDTATGRQKLSDSETQHIYRTLPLCTPRCRLGQPVNYSATHTALRLCLSARQLVQALSSRQAGQAVIKEALVVLQQVALLANSGDVL